MKKVTAIGLVVAEKGENLEKVTAGCLAVPGKGENLEKGNGDRPGCARKGRKS
ncbi:hypothetical protein MUB24_16960 [Lederbergia sp. NSJ-179]|uniref:hypothetical protein n=1 Tax=Lederbergia sp. NSJ-179 TaxID=2931402 RepID=UPI001FD1DB26|nr:hypothetical protein [Lederbergia sp. NSJ-179]MCJ7842556.1 hypothetical protein [Lederbergia sp. NSJ-179]